MRAGSNPFGEDPPPPRGSNSNAFDDGGSRTAGANNRTDYGMGLVNPKAKREAEERRRRMAENRDSGGFESVDPFDTSSSKDAVPMRRQTSRDGSVSRGGGSNPFDFDADYPESKGGSSEGGPVGRLAGRAMGSIIGNFGRSGGHGQRGGVDDTEDSEPIMSGMDADDSYGARNRKGHQRSQSQSVGQNGVGPNSRPSNLAQRSRTGGATMPAGGGGGGGIGANMRTSIAAGNLASWLKGNKAEDEGELASDTINGDSNVDASGYTSNPAHSNSGVHPTPQDSKPKKTTRLSIMPVKKKKEAQPSPYPTVNRMAGTQPLGQKVIKGGRRKVTIQRWPYDDYHTAQESYYESLDGGLNDDDDDENMLGGAVGGGYLSGSDDEDNPNHPSKAHVNTGDDGAKIYERPKELPSIKEDVQGLRLVDFESKAQERAIGIISTWLFDAGLIDELLVNGAVGYRPSILSSASSMGDASRASSTKTSEGVEVGAHGFPIGVDGGLKMDKEIEKLRASAQRELSLINARLNDGVAASGAEVQELVNAVAATKGDLGRLRELSTYISNGCKTPSEDGEAYSGPGSEMDARDEFLLANFPKLRSAINARRNLFRCFRELEFFSQIPSTCDRLREELHAGEWTTNEWSTIRNVCMEHVELEILLVEAEAGMKARIDYEGADEGQELVESTGGANGRGGPGASMRGPRGKSLKSKFASFRGSAGPGKLPAPGGGFQTTMPGNYEAVDNFLSVHVKNVWELGEEIRMRILSGIGSSFDLAMNNPAGMVALVEAVEVYERAAEQYQAMYDEEEARYGGPVGGSGGGKKQQRLHFTDMRAAALAQIYQDFELRGLEVFRAIHMRAADMAEEEDALNSQFTAVLRAATELVAEIELVKNDMAPCFAPHWNVETLWSSCVAHVCSNQILQQIGGPDGHNLPDLTVTQLLDLVAWVEYFRETIEEAFPNVANMHAKRTYLDTRPDLFAGDAKAVDLETATDSLAWVNNMLWEVHRLAQDEFLARTKDQTDEWLDNVYRAEHEKNQSQEGRLTTSLCEDVFSLAGVQLRTIRERLSRKSYALVMAVCLIFSHLRSKQIHARNNFLQDLETCCAAANDFIRMSEQCEEVMSELLRECEFDEEDILTLEASSSELLSLYSNDAVYAAQSVHIYIFEPIRDAIADELFGGEWEESLTHNELALTLVRTLEDFMGDLEQYLDELMVRKTLDALVSSTVVFYVKCLLLKAENHASVKVSCFSDNEKALERINGDIKVMRDYFEGLTEDTPGLARVIEREFEILTTIHECMSIAADLSESDASDFILVLQKRVRDVDITKHVVGDLWHLVSPTQERAVWELVESMEEQLNAIAPKDDNAVKEAHDRSAVPGLRMDEFMAMHYIESKRKRPVKAGAVEKMVKGWKMSWTTDETAPGGRHVDG